MRKDNYDLTVSCASDAALQAYLSGVDCALRFDAPGIDELSSAITLDEEFALAHAALSRQLLIHGFREQSRAHMGKALALRAQATPRERAAIEVTDQANRLGPLAIQSAQQHVAAWPQDVFVLSHLLGPFGLLAFSGERDWPEQNIALLKATKSAYRSDDWWHLTTSGFFAAETGEYVQAREECESAWSISANGNCAHSLAHLHFETGGIDEGTTFIKEWLPAAGKESDMRHHMVWHLAFLDLESGIDIEEIFPAYDRELDSRVSDPMPLTTLSDNAAFLWRAFLAGKSSSTTTLTDLREYASTHYTKCGFYFMDIHKAMGIALLADVGQQQDFLQQLHEVSEARATRAASSVETFAQAFAAFCDDAYEEVVQLLEPVLDDSVFLGGSNPQRRIVEDTYLEACMRCGHYRKARAILQERDRPSSTFDQNLLHRTNT